MAKPDYSSMGKEELEKQHLMAMLHETQKPWWKNWIFLSAMIPTWLGLTFALWQIQLTRDEQLEATGEAQQALQQLKIDLAMTDKDSLIGQLDSAVALRDMSNAQLVERCMRADSLYRTLQQRAGTERMRMWAQMDSIKHARIEPPDSAKFAAKDMEIRMLRMGLEAAQAPGPEFGMFLQSTRRCPGELERLMMELHYAGEKNKNLLARLEKAELQRCPK